MERFRASDGVRIAYRTRGEPGERPPVVLHHGFIVDGARNFEAPGTVAALVAADDPLATRPEVLAAAIPGARWRVVSGNHLTALRSPAYVPALLDFLDG